MKRISMNRLSYFPFLIFLILVVSCENHKEDTPVIKIEEDFEKLKDSSVVETPPVLSSLVCQNALDSITDTSLNQLISDLRKSILNKDTTLLFSIMDSSIVTSYGGGMIGFDDFKYNWKGRDVWAKLDKIVRKGGNFSNDATFRFPFFTIEQNCQEDYHWVEGEEYSDPYTTYYSISDTAFLYSGASDTTEIKASLVGVFLNRPPDTYDAAFDSEMLELTTLDKKYRGFVASKDLYRTGDYNLIIELDSNRVWRITSFAPFD